MPASPSLIAEHAALDKKITDMKTLLGAASAEITPISSVPIGDDDASAKAAIETMRQSLSNVQHKVVHILPGGTPKKHHQKSKKQQKKKGGKSRRQRK